MFRSSKENRRRLKDEEGWRLVPYLCPAGKWTISAGVRLYPGDKIPGLVYIKLTNTWVGKISEAQAEALLSSRIAQAEKTLDDLVKVPLNQNQVDALVLFVFNIGRRQFAVTTLLAYLNQRLYGSAAAQFKRWVHDDDGRVIEGLVNRQRRTEELFKKPQLTEVKARLL